MKKFINARIYRRPEENRDILVGDGSPFEAVRQRADVLASVRHGEYLFKRPEPGYDIEPDVFRGFGSGAARLR